MAKWALLCVPLIAWYSITHGLFWECNLLCSQNALQFACGLHQFTGELRALTSLHDCWSSGPANLGGHTFITCTSVRIPFLNHYALLQSKWTYETSIR